ncbi:amidohydrolase family protein [Opitutales bacterium ASA1]|nr:amidohydrolase family protein [Opitutales bacterium ASA1]
MRESTVPLAGLREAPPRVHALVDARIVLAAGDVIERGTLVVRDGVVAAVGADVAVPAEARVWDMAGKTLYPGFIESHASFGLPAEWDTLPASERSGSHAWNERVVPERRVADAWRPDEKAAEGLRKLGFTVAHVVPTRGVFRGSSAVVSLAAGSARRLLLQSETAQIVEFEFGAYSERKYPTSLMGSIALVRQTLADAKWHREIDATFARGEGVRAGRPEFNLSLAAIEPVIAGRRRLLVQLRDELDFDRAVALAEEFEVELWLRASGFDYRVARHGAATSIPTIVPVVFPEVPSIDTPEQALDHSLDRLEHWELAPTNPARLVQAGVPIALTSAGLRKPADEFWPALRRAIQHGLAPDEALTALTTAPVAMLGLASARGTLRPGASADVVVADGDLFRDERAKVVMVWIDGLPVEWGEWRRDEIRGRWTVRWSGVAGPAEWTVSGGDAASAVIDLQGEKVSVQREGDVVALSAPATWFGAAAGVFRLSGRVARDEITGHGVTPGGTTFSWSAVRSGAADAGASRATSSGKVEPESVSSQVYPAGAYGRSGLPEQPAVLLIRGATLWTSGPRGVLPETDMLVERGRIARIGRGLRAPAGAVVVEARGKWVTSGIIDAHSHAGVNGGVNEGAQAVTCEVRIADVLDPTDINLYRQLAGGTTTINVLHGSANPIGGQSAVIKLRWGGRARDLVFEGATPGVKFALGENVTQKSIQGAQVRYPASRMGVREIIEDTFVRAREYGRARSAGTDGPPLRRDLELEAALEIVENRRRIHIHSYRQDEVLMFVRLAQEWGLRDVVFQHILEGYKVAPEIASIGASGSSFADWWAYKAEVSDAIPHNGALMREAGVGVSFNSDDAELARRLNTEAAKATKYGDVPPEEALKFVTIEAARQLGVADRVGSLEAGKDADFVVWSAEPLSTFARAEQTWIDGRPYFTLEDDARMRASATARRAALEQKILAEKRKKPNATRPAGDPEPERDVAPKPAVLLLLESLARRGADGTGLYGDGACESCCSGHGGASR